MVYLDFLVKAFKKQYAYRANSYIRMFASFVAIFISINIWQALFRSNAVVNGVTLPDMVTYVIISAFLTAFSSANIGTFIANKVKDGSIIIDFIRPVNFKRYVFSEQIGQNAYSLLFGVALPCVVMALVYGFRFPENPVILVYFIAALLLGAWLNYQIEYVLGLLSFWFKTSFYVDWFLNAFHILFAGTVVPLWFYPDALYKISAVMPFRFVTFEPISLYLGRLAPGTEWQVPAFQICWILGLVLLEKIMWSRIQRKIEIYGG